MINPKIAAIIALISCNEISHAQIFYKDMGEYSFDGFSITDPVYGNYLQDRRIAISTAIPTGSLVYVTFNVSSIKRDFIGDGVYKAPISQFVTPSFFALYTSNNSNAGSNFYQANLILGKNTLSTNSTAIAERIQFGPDFWSNDYAMTVSNICVYSGSSCEAVDTLISLEPNAFALRNAFNLQSNNIAQGLSYDCTLFDEKNICASFTGTRSTQNGSNVDATTGTLVIAHRPAANVRFGGYINQNLSTSNQGGLRLERSNPGLGAFVNYTLASGLNVRGSIGYGKMDMETTREAIDTAEAGVGKSNIKSQGVQIELNKAFDIKPGWTATPYGGLRKVTTKRAGYSETASDTVTAPLTYADLQQSQTTAFGGVRFLGNIAPQTQLLLSAGVERDMSSTIDDYAATGVEGLGSISMQGNVKKTRPVLSAALSYDIAKNERASVGVHHRQEAFDSKAITSVGFTYTKGF